MGPAILLAMQAAGMVVDYMGKQEQVRLGRMGAQVEEAGINANIASSRLQAEDESLQSMVALRKNLGTQAAMLAARGTRAGAGTAIVAPMTSVSNFNADERIRKINQMGRENSLKANKVLSSLHQQTSENNIWNEFRQNIINKIPTSPAAYNEWAKSFGLSKVGG